MSGTSLERPMISVVVPNALVQLRAQYNHSAAVASEKRLSAGTSVRPHRETVTNQPRKQLRDLAYPAVDV